MKSRAISPKVLRVLYARSGNRCAFPGCDLPIFEDDNQLTGECCHIEAYSKEGPRYNDVLSDDKCNGYDNLILLCSRHHKIVDADYHTYTVEYLKEMKRVHEETFRASNLKLTAMMVTQLQESSKRFWHTIQSIHTNDTIGLHREINQDLSLEDLMDIVDANFNQIEEFMEHFEESDNHFKEELCKVCQRLDWDFDKLEQIPYYENPFHAPNWEMHNLGRPNIMADARMHYYALMVRALEKISQNDSAFITILEKWKLKFYSFQNQNYYAD